MADVEVKNVVDKKIEITEEKTEKKSVNPSWMRMKKADLEKIVVGLAKEGKDPAEIGAVLRDKHGVPKARLLGRKISQILKEKGVEFDDSKKTVERRVENLKGHIGKNKHDYPASRALTKHLWELHWIEKK
jgi:ribosomal protein S15P/S13E